MSAVEKSADGAAWEPIEDVVAAVSIGAVAAVVATVSAEVSGAVLGGGNGAENIEPTAVVPKNCGTEGASGCGGAERRAASDGGRNAWLAAVEAEAVMAAAARRPREAAAAAAEGWRRP